MSPLSMVVSETKDLLARILAESSLDLCTTLERDLVLGGACAMLGNPLRLHRLGKGHARVPDENGAVRAAGICDAEPEDPVVQVLLGQSRPSLSHAYVNELGFPAWGVPSASLSKNRRLARVLRPVSNEGVNVQRIRLGSGQFAGGRTTRSPRSARVSRDSERQALLG